MAERIRKVDLDHPEYEQSGAPYNHIFEAIRFDNTRSIEPFFDRERPIRSTGDMMTWYTSRPCAVAKRSHISHVVFDGTWED